MALLLPFNIATIEGILQILLTLVWKRRFFKYDFRFYAGALIAIDSAKTLGFPIDVEIYDSRETKIIQLLLR
jgi:hypothetical protein